ncbi:tetratricopeptide repeat protein [Streptomyces buecherae]|uniref:tetratricopeptide repeat protein n=1 Tax=Streptomyces buecherae TaxID=2763006 RepID=UPI003406C0CB
MRGSPSGLGDALFPALLAHSANRESAAWQELALAIAGTRTNDAVAPLMRFHETTPDQARVRCRHLADLLGQSCADDARLVWTLTRWLQRHAQAAAPGGQVTAKAVANTIGGNSVIHGPSVQARDVYGGLHFHSQHPEPGHHNHIPHQLPSIFGRFIGRAGDLAALDTLWDQSATHAARFVVVTGPAGVGKTTLVTHWLRRHESNFSDGRLYADLGGHLPSVAGMPASSDVVIKRFLTALGVRQMPPDAAQRVDLWRSVTYGLRLAVVLENVQSAEQARPLLLGSVAGLTVVTSRNRLSRLRADGALMHGLDPLTDDSALELLAVGGGHRVSREPDAAREVIRLCGRLPLALCLVSAQLADRPHRSLSSLADSLARGNGAVDTLRVEGEAIMRNALDSSYEALPDGSAELYRRMGLLPTNRYDIFMLAAIAGNGRSQGAGESQDTVDVLDLAVQDLVEAHFLEETGPETYRFHDLVYLHARHLGKEHSDIGTEEYVLSRYVEWCLATAAKAELILVPSHRLPGHDVSAGAVSPTPLVDPEEALEWLDAHRDGLLGAIRHCAQVGWHHACWRLTDLVWPLFQRFRPSDMWLEAHRLGLEAARASNSRPGEVRMLSSGAFGLRDAGRYTEASEWDRQALAIAVADGDVQQQAQALNGLGHTNLLANRLVEARECLEHAMRLRESIGSRRGAALSLRRLGETALASGDVPGAARHLQRASDELGAINEVYEATRAQALLGQVLVRAGDPEEGARRLRLSLARFRSRNLRSHHWEGRCLEWLGAAAEALGDTGRATAYYQEAVALLRRLSPSDAVRLEDRLRLL